MPAPPAALVTALRRGTARRHLFFYMPHVSGAFAAWDGVGSYSLGGQTYLGIGGVAEITGISDSADPQNHRVECRLPGVPLPAMLATDPRVQGAIAEIRAAWIDENGAAIASRVMFRGPASALYIDLGYDSIELRLSIKSKFADWALAPLAYYTDQWQRAKYPGDTGFSAVAGLEALEISGWSVNAPTSGGQVELYASVLRDTASGRIIGSPTRGALAGVTAAVWFIQAAGNLREETTTAENAENTSQRLAFGGSSAYVDETGTVRTAGGKRVYPGTLVTDFIRAAATQLDGVPSVVGTTTDGVSFALPSGTLAPVRVANASDAGLRHVLQERGGALYRRAADGALGFFFNRSASPTFVAQPYLEAVTGTPLTCTAAGALQVGGVNCNVSSTGVVLTAAGRRVYLSGQSPTTHYLRVFT